MTRILTAFATFASFGAASAAGIGEAAAGALTDELMGPRAMAMGGAHVAVPNDNAALFFNPAGISWGQKYAIELGYAHSFELKSHSGHLSVVDSKSSTVGGGLSVSYVNSRPLDAGGTLIRTGWDVRFALSYPISDRVFVGVMNKLVTRRLDPRGVEEPKDSDLPPNDIKKYAVDVGVLIAITNGITLGVAGTNLTLPRDPEMPTTVRAGLGVSLSIVTVTADYVADFTTLRGKVLHSLHAGAEVFLFNAMAIRAGYMLSGAEADGDGGFGMSHWVSGGLGYVSKSFAVDGAYKRKLIGPDPTGTEAVMAPAYPYVESGDTFTVAFRIFL